MPEEPNVKLREPLPPPTCVTPCELPYAELEVTTNFSFLRGASHPDELVYQAATLGYRAIAITDHNTLAGVVRAHAAARSCGMKLIVGSRLVFQDNTPDLLVWPTDRAAYGRLCRLLTTGKRRAEKGECHLYLGDFLEHSDGLLAAACLPLPSGEARGQGSGVRGQDQPATDHWPLATADSSREPLYTLHDVLRDRLSLVVSRLYANDDASHLQRMIQVSRETRIPLLATNGVHYHDPRRRALQDVLTCVRHGCTIHQAGFRLFPNGERYLKSPEQMHRLFSGHPQAIRRGLEIARQCNFSMDELRYEYPDELVPPGQTPIEYLSHLAWTGAAERYPVGVPERVRRQIEHELKLIEQLRFEAYFLTVYDLVKYARGRSILCQGRGSAANSAVCYCIGVTSVDPAKVDLLFERFVSAARNEPPDIDVDFEHERREEVIQYVYQKYGRDRAGIAAEVITYRGRSAVRDVGKAMGLSLDMVDAMAKKLDWWHRGTLSDAMIREAGLDPNDSTVRQIIDLTVELLGFPRHLSQHVGGMVMTRGPLCELVPIENAAMDDRTVIEWDKDDIDELGILKVDVLALGMLTCISKAFGMLRETKRRRDGETKWKEGGADGESEHVSGSHSLAKGDEAGEAHLSSDLPDAQRGAVWPDQPDETSCSFHSIQHRRRFWTAEPSGADQVSAGCAGIVERTRDPARAGERSEHAEGDARADRITPGTRSSPAGAHPQSGTQTSLTSSHFVSPSLRLSVSSSFRASVPSCLELHTIPPDDPAVYDMICDADTIGVFQIESRAQMSMLPRLRPRCFYDLVIEVAIVRPGPIQGNMVHPYLRRRNGEEAVSYPSEALRQVLQKTLGVPLFQEQAMKIAMVGAGFSGAEADQLRRAMAAWRKSGQLLTFHDKIVNGMLKNGYTREFAEQCFEQIKGFGEYGFPESHSASFALLVYVSAWLKRHHPAAFCAALLNSQPMGFYQPAQIVRDAREHGVEVRAIDVNYSGWDCTLEDGKERRRDGETERRSEGNGKDAWGLCGPAVRLGFRQIKGLRQSHGQTIATAQQREGRFSSVNHFHRATNLPVSVIRRLAEADTFQSLGLTRRQAFWSALELNNTDTPLFENAPAETTSSLRLSVSSSLLPPHASPPGGQDRL